MPLPLKGVALLCQAITLPRILLSPLGLDVVFVRAGVS